MVQEDLRALVLLSRTSGIRMTGLRPFFEEGKRPAEIIERVASSENRAWRESLEETRRIFDPGRELERAEELGIQVIPFRDSRYPSLLKETADPPLILYVRGTLLESDQAAGAIVGSRHPSLYGVEQATRFGRRLAEQGLTIVSGFARGIDRAAHEGALEISYGRTIAVLGSGVDVVYPREHRPLYEEIQERGALVSEFALGAPPLAENFPKRNRIIAGLSLGVLVVEAHSRSGSLITAHLAAEEGREVFALPGRVDQLGSRGTHRLLKEGATLVESPEDLFDTLIPQLRPLVPDSRKDLALEEGEEEFLSLFEKAPLRLDEAAKRGNQTVARAATLLTALELKGALRKRLDGRYERL